MNPDLEHIEGEHISIEEEQMPISDAVRQHDSRQHQSYKEVLLLSNHVRGNLQSVHARCKLTLQIKP